MGYTNLLLNKGGGYYDRLLPTFSGTTVALAFCEQLLDDLPMESHDQYIQKIIGEGITYHCV